MTNLRIHVEGPTVQLIAEGRLLLEMPWNAALEVGRLLVGAAHEAEEHAKAAQIAYDEAILLRAGAPLGLTKNRDVQREALAQARYDPKLRRYLPHGMGVPYRGVVGTPTLRQSPAKPQP
ncbi:MAG TPA: hypothetical protein VII06_09655 [Chloroflexota bacterium]|jgi:hypothetical protein